jgi:hypothetical protein
MRIPKVRGIEERVSADRRGLRIESNETSTYFRVGALHNVVVQRKYIMVVVTPRERFAIPTRALATPAEAKRFGVTLRDAVKAARRARL